MKLQTKSLSEIESTATSVAFVAAIICVGLEFAIMARNGWEYVFRIVNLTGGGFGLYGSSILLYGLLFVAVVKPTFEAKGVWVLGLMWGFAEVIWNIEISFLVPGTLSPNFSSIEWISYMSFVFILFASSVYVLRDKLRFNKLTISLTGLILIYTPVLFLIRPEAVWVPVLYSSLQEYQVLFNQLPYQCLIIADVLLLMGRPNRADFARFRGGREPSRSP